MKTNIKKTEVKEFNNIKEILYESKEKYGYNIAFVIKHKKMTK